MAKEKEKPEDTFRHEWQEVQICALLIRKGRAKIMVRKRKDGRKFRYTKVIG